jgi:hypothetical protein
MGCSKYDPAMQGRPAWNAGKMVGTKRPFTQKQIWAVRFFLDREGRLRDKALRPSNRQQAPSLRPGED